MIDLIGETFGSYTIEASIGSDATGQVYRARHIHLGRPAMLKVLERGATTAPDFPDHFQDAMRRAAALRHPNIIDIYDFGVQNGYAYMALEPVDAGALSALTQHYASKHMPCPIALAVDLACQAADGLAYAHAQGDIHGAISPASLLLQRQGNGSAGGGRLRLKIAYFGLAQLLPAATLRPPAYLSPEQYQGRDLDARSDLYSLGVVLYELVAGAPPFAAATFEEGASEHLHMLPPPPRQHRPDLPATLEAVILRCLAKSPEQRFGTAGELAAALRQAQSSPPAPTAAAARAAPDSAPSPAIVAASATSSQSTPAPSPQVQVLDAQGRVLQTANLTKAGLTVGRTPENDVCLDDAAVARNHLLIAWHDPQVLATDLGSSTATFLGGQRLLPFVQQPWDRRAVLSVGPFRLKLLQAAPDDPTLQGRHDTASTTGPATPPFGVGRIGVRLDPEQLTLTPGEPAVVRVTMFNHGSTMDRLSVAVTGIPSTWVRGAEQAVQLSPGAEATIPLTIEVPRAPESLPNDYDVSVRARSATNADESGSAGARWTVLPYSACDLRVAPQKVSGRTVAEYQVNVRNGGNTPASYLLSAADDEKVLKYTLAQDQVLLEPGQLATVKLTVSAPRRLFGSDQPRAFTVWADIPNGLSESGTAQFIQHALLPVWLPLVLALLALFAVVLNRVLPSISGGAPPPATVAAGPTAPPATVAAGPTAPPTAAPSPTAAPGAPVVNLFAVEPQVVEPGQPVMVSWDVQGAERVTISQFGDVPPQGQREHRPEQTTDYRLIAVSGGMTTTRIERVNVVAPATVVEPSVVPSPVPTAPPPPPEPTAAPEPTLAPPPPAPVNLLDLAPNARWQADNRTVRFGQPAGDPERGGWADFASNVTLEDGQPYASALYTVPTTNTTGYIQGEFTIPQIQAGQFFLADIGFGQDAHTSVVTVTVRFSGEIIWQGTKQPNGSLIAIAVDLAHVAGRAGQLTLRVDGSGGTARDGIYWIRPRIDVPSRP